MFSIRHQVFNENLILKKQVLIETAQKHFCAKQVLIKIAQKQFQEITEE